MIVERCIEFDSRKNALYKTFGSSSKGALLMDKTIAFLMIQPHTVATKYLQLTVKSV